MRARNRFNASLSRSGGERARDDAHTACRWRGCVRCPCRTVTHAPCFYGHHFGADGQILSNVDRAVHHVVPHGGIVRAIHYVYLDLHGSGQGREALVLSHSLQLVRFSLAGKESMETDKTTSLVVLSGGAAGPGARCALYQPCFDTGHYGTHCDILFDVNGAIRGHVPDWGLIVPVYHV